MSDERSTRVTLGGGPGRTTSWVYFDESGELVVEFYDHSETAEATFGNDVAFLLYVDARGRAAIRALLGCEEPAIPEALAARFASYFDVKQWLEESGIEYRKHFDSWA